MATWQWATVDDHTKGTGHTSSRVLIQINTPPAKIANGDVNIAERQSKEGGILKDRAVEVYDVGNSLSLTYRDVGVSRMPRGLRQIASNDQAQGCDPLNRPKDRQARFPQAIGASIV